MKTILLLLSAVLVAILAYQWRDWPQPLPQGEVGGAGELEAVPIPGTSPAQPEEQLLRPAEDYAVIAERPLFLPDRRPPKEEEAGPVDDLSAEVADLERLDVTATLILPPGEASVWLKAPESQELVRLRLGDEYEGWTVAEIETDRVVMERQGARETLELLDFSATNPAQGRARPPLDRGGGAPPRTQRPLVRRPALPSRTD